MVFAESDGFAVPAEDSPGVSSVGDDVVGRSEEEDVGGAADPSSDEFLFELVGLFVFVADDSQLILAFRRLEQFVDIFEGFF